MTSQSPVERFCVRGLGVEIVIESDHTTIHRRARDAWSDAVCELTQPDPLTVTVSFEPGADVYSPDLDEILHNLSPAVTREAIGARAGELVMLHAAALADPSTGATAVLVAPSGTGKTTAATTLGRSFSYLTDETAGITVDGLVLAYKKPLSMIEGGAFKTQVAPSDLGMITSVSSGRLTALFVLERDPAHEGPPRVTPMDTIDALAEIAPQVSFLGEFDRPLQRLRAILEIAGGARHVIYRESQDLEPVVGASLVGVRS